LPHGIRIGVKALVGIKHGIIEGEIKLTGLAEGLQNMPFNIRIGQSGFWRVSSLPSW